MPNHQTKRRGNKRSGHGRKRKSSHIRQKGGFGGAFASIVKTALVPFGIFAAQKMVQSRKTKSRRSRR